MRRKDKEIKDRKDIESIIRKADICRIALSDKNSPYIVPVNFGYKENCLYFHSAKEGKKIDIIRRNNKVCFECDVDVELVRTGNPCDWTTKYHSVIGQGEAFFLNDLGEKEKALDIILEHYSDDKYEYDEKAMNSIAVIKVEIESMTGKKSGY